MNFYEVCEWVYMEILCWCLRTLNNKVTTQQTQTDRHQHTNTNRICSIGTVGSKHHKLKNTHKKLSIWASVCSENLCVLGCVKADIPYIMACCRSWEYSQVAAGVTVKQSLKFWDHMTQIASTFTDFDFFLVSFFPFCFCFCTHLFISVQGSKHTA